ncbi:MAG TPA: hypothetical protein VK253_00585 [Candidatus Binatia bacterium]|nr:hypothetical protein [Candidatus Binatia bacterium]
MDQFVSRLGFWSATIIVLLVALIDAGMILSAIFYPMTTITSVEAYADSFTSLQMLAFIPSLILAPMFVIMMLGIYHTAPQEKKTLTQLGFSFSLI